MLGFSEAQADRLLGVLKNHISTRLWRWLLAGLLTSVIGLLPLEYFESYLYDLRMRVRPAPVVSKVIETVFVDPSSVQALRGLPSWAHHAQFLKVLADERPKAIVYLMNPKEFSGNNTEQKLFVERALSIPNFYIVTEELAMRGEVGKFDLPGILKELRVMSGPVTSDSKILAQDGVTRRLMLTYQGNILFHPFLVSQLIPERAIPKNIRGEFSFYDSEQAYIDMSPTGSFPRLSFNDVMEQKFPQGQFSNKIVFLGTDLGQSTKEYIKTPYSRQVTAMTVVEAHANIVNSLIRNSGVRQLPRGLNILLLLLMVVISVEVVLAMKPVKGLIVLGLALLIFAIGSFICFWPFGYWVHMAHPLLGVFIAYYFLVPYRLIMENRRSWELYQKHKLLTQVEELKTNFIGMMSHDLKTPLARIQGMVDLVLRDKNPLSDEQKQSMRSIRQSTEDLLGFISSILNFSKIESQGVQLNLKSKDINALIGEVVSKSEYLAREKSIKIVQELEPLFSIKIDADLMRQVLSNLVENAIKYSPRETEVRIKTLERENRVLVHIIDQGVGIPADEMPRLFMKFFRSRKAKNSTVKGSGLGLYLSRYFVELHGGKLIATSVENEGSTFTIELPLST